MQSQTSVAQLVSSSLISWFWIFIAIFAIAGFAIGINALNRVQNLNGIQLDITPVTQTALGTEFCNNRAIVYLPASAVSQPTARLPKCPTNATVEFLPGGSSLDGSVNILSTNGFSVQNVKTGTTGDMIMSRGRRIVCTNAGQVTNDAQSWSCLATEGLSDPTSLQKEGLQDT